MLKFVLLGLLAGEPRHGYDLKGVFEQLLGGTWPLNIAQVYTALGKLEGEGLITCEVVPQGNVPDRKVYSLTPVGREELDAWMSEPAEGPVRLRDELFMKVLVQVSIEGGDPLGLIARQRQASMRALARLGRAQAEAGLEAATSLLLEGAALRIEADLKWLERCEERLRERG
ncbi:MAG: PadR family transcriptional regulator [Acidimicrobiales bacterium]|jgi:DNA-binding PadR family transcriptional regulator|nr:PadR family transcriptional regulator [Acidimicrobiales bacterium]